jgi:hypothetical protein
VWLKNLTVAKEGTSCDALRGLWDRRKQYVPLFKIVCTVFLSLFDPMIAGMWLLVDSCISELS